MWAEWSSIRIGEETGNRPARNIKRCGELWREHIDGLCDPEVPDIALATPSVIESWSWMVGLISVIIEYDGQR